MIYFSKAEVAAQCRQSERTIDRAIAAGRLRVVKIDGRVRISETDADQYARECYRLANYGPDSTERRRIAKDRAAAVAQAETADDGEAPKLAEPIGETLAEGWSANVMGGYHLAFGNRVEPLVREPTTGLLMTRQEFLRWRAENRAVEAAIDAELARRDAMAAAGARRSDERSAEPSPNLKEPDHAE